VKSKPIAKATVENDNGKLLWVGVTIKKSAKIGIIGKRPLNPMPIF